MIDLGTDEFDDVREIGRGGYGIVYTARQPAFGRTVAIKVLTLADEGTLRRFDRERQALGKVSNHPHITPVFASGFTADGKPYLAMEFMRGGSLADRLMRDGALPWEEVLDLGVKLSGALETAHRAGILHRDLKPANVLLSDFGEPRLADFGIASIDDGEQTKTGVITASIAYAAPEILDGKRPEVPADIYGLSATLFTLVAGTPPFFAEGDQSLLAMVVRVARDPVPDLRARGVPDAMARVLETGMAKDANARYPSAQALGEALAQAQAAVGLRRTALVLPQGDQMPATAVTGTPAATGWPEPTPAPPPPSAAAPVPVSPSAGSPSTNPPPSPFPAPVGLAPETSGGWATPPEPSSSRRGVLVGLGVLLLVVLGAGGFLLSRGGGDDDSAGAGSDDVTVAGDPDDADADPSGGDPADGDDATDDPGATPKPGEETPDEPSGIEAGEWQEVRPMELARQQVPSVELRGTVWVTGGLTEEGVTATVEGYEAATNSWRSAPDLPVPLHHHMAAVHDGEIVVLGGWSPDGALLSAITQDRVFALRGDEWVELPPLLQPRVAGTAQSVGGLLVVTGGQGVDGNLVLTTEVFDGTAWTEVAPLPVPREHLASATDGTYMYVVGGRVLSSDANLPDLERYDPATDTWETLAPMPTARGGLAAVYADGWVVAIGGERPLGVFDDVEAYDSLTGEWRELPPLLVGRHGLGASVATNLVVVAGGALEATHSAPTGVAEVVSIG
ncbi:protein kinase domain-containing protein [Euzebya rosea]|uniref:protein kinase domain-containing protein n=1 Tax=Euzebya rosea TaxID=2052804 RepID=UPI000D3E5296|nr:kelch repeat-containing protein [Euzebya rosea]